MSKEEIWVPAAGDRVRIAPAVIGDRHVFVIKKIQHEEAEAISTANTGKNNKIVKRSA